MVTLCSDTSCVECGGKGRIASGREACPNRPERASWAYWLCSCGAYVGCHTGTAIPMGRPGNATTRYWRIAAHRALDKRWMRSDQTASKRATNRSRPKAYTWLACQLGISFDDCHIGMFDEAMCRRVVEVCGQVRRAA